MNWWLHLGIIIGLIGIIISLIIESKNDVFLFLFHHKIWKEWYKYEMACVGEYYFVDIINGNYIFHNGLKTAIVWNEDDAYIGGLCSVSDLTMPNNSCKLSTYYRKPSRRMAKMLLKKEKSIH